MTRPSKLTPEIQKRIGDNIALGLTYRLAAESVGITYKTLNEWNQKGQTEKSGKYYKFAQYIQKYNANAAKALLERINESAKAGDTQMCTWGYLNAVLRQTLDVGYIRKRMLLQKI